MSKRMSPLVHHQTQFLDALMCYPRPSDSSMPGNRNITLTVFMVNHFHYRRFAFLQFVLYY